MISKKYNREYQFPILTESPWYWRELLSLVVSSSLICTNLMLHHMEILWCIIFCSFSSCAICLWGCICRFLDVSLRKSDFTSATNVCLSVFSADLNLLILGLLVQLTGLFGGSGKKKKKDSRSFLDKFYYTNLSKHNLIAA